MNILSRRDRWLPLACALSLTRAVIARADSGAARDPVAAEALFHEGKDLLKSENWLAACTKFERSMQLDPAVSTLVKIAKCREHEGKLAAAWYEYQRAIKLNREVTTSDHRRSELDAFIAAEVAKLSPRVPWLTVTVLGPSAGIEATRDGVSMALGEAVPVDPGEHVLLVRAPGFAEQRQLVTLAEAQQRAVEIRLLPAAGPPTPAAAPRAPIATPPVATPPVGASPVGRSPVAAPTSRAPEARASSSAQRDWGLLATGLGAAALVEGALLGYRTLSLVHDSDRECQGTLCSPKGDQMRSDARHEQTLALASAVVGVLGTGIGVSLIIMSAPKKAAPPQAALRITVGPLSVAARGSW